MWLFLPVSFFFVLLYWWDSKTINRVLFRFLIGRLPKHLDAHQRSPPTASDLSAVTFKGTEREKNKKSLASSSLSFSRLGGREEDQALESDSRTNVSNLKSPAFASGDDLPGLNSQLDTPVNGRLLGRVCLSSSCSPDDAVTAGDSCADIKTSSCLSSAQKD